MPGRRDMLGLLAALAAGAPARTAFAQDPRAFEDSFRVITPRPTTTGDRIEVIDFFWYGCPYCYQLLPLFIEWEKTKPADVAVRRIPAVLRQEWVPDAHLYYAFDLLGVIEQLHARIFEAIHRDRLLATDVEGWGKWAVSNGIERAKWDAAYHARSVRDNVVKAVDAARDYDVRGTPAVIVEGRYQTGSGSAGSVKNVMPTVDALIKMVREQRSAKT
jgi:thiol:disulfide interchange protein DsbA